MKILRNVIHRDISKSKTDVARLTTKNWAIITRKEFTMDHNILLLILCKGGMLWLQKQTLII